MAVSSEHQLVAPNLIRSQALALLLPAVRHGDITEEVALHRHERITEHGLETTFDAEYIAVTKRQADALVTIDPALATKAALMVPVAPVAALSVD